MKRRFFVVLLLLFLLCPSLSHADMGPKPYVSVHITGSDTRYYATLLSSPAEYGPWRANTVWTTDAPDAIQQKFQQFTLPEDYYFLGYVAEAAPRDFRWGYYPPETFRILLYDEKADHFLLSAPLTRHALQNEYTVTVKEDRITDIQFRYDYLADVPKLLALIVGTILIELAVAYLLGIRKAVALRYIALVNLGTQALLHLGLWFIGFRLGTTGIMQVMRPVLLLPLEALVLGIEAFLYRRKLPKEQHPVRYAVLANLVSYTISLLIP
ncbi:hypothetical protein [uncultured Murdochiella sp.]|uniref:hypothetical protein n=1 Tax=uncultured Murdochiella sp. TaxID=1586095 RepID=UPI002803E306|nr:hypothetical protein [uncultured Murdochiella sp.]